MADTFVEKFSHLIREHAPFEEVVSLVYNRLIQLDQPMLRINARDRDLKLMNITDEEGTRIVQEIVHYGDLYEYTDILEQAEQLYNPNFRKYLINRNKKRQEFREKLIREGGVQINPYMIKLPRKTKNEN